jgi:signal transduction histidine kinase/HAMP domain-containing protein
VTRSRAPRSLVRRLVLATVVAGTAAAVLGGLVLGRVAQSTLQEEVLARNAALAQELATRFDSTLDRAITELGVVATRVHLAGLDPEAAVDLRTVLRAAPTYDELILLDPRGRPVAAAASASEAETAQSPERPELADSVAAAGTYVGLIESFPPALELGVPVEHPPGSLVGVLLARIPLEVLAGPIQQVSHPPGPVRFLVDADGRILVHPERDRMAAAERFPVGEVLGSPAQASSMEVDGRQVLVAAAPTRHLGGAVVLQHAVSEALRPQWGDLGRLVLTLVLVLAAVVVAVSIAGSRLLRPLGPLVDAVQRIGRGERGVRAAVRGKGEITLLGQEFDRMSETLDQREAALQELQRLALLVSAVLDRDRLAEELVQGAQMLLRAEGCAYTLVDDTAEPALLATAGAAPEPEALRRAVRDCTERAEGALLHNLGDQHGVSLPVTTLGGALLGVLTAVRNGAPFGQDEVQLAETLTAFGGVALDNAHRLELEQALVNELQESVERRRLLIGSVSHEFRTPLTCIEGFSRTLLERWAQFSDEERQDLVSRIDAHGRDLDRLVTQLLDFAGTERGTRSSDVIAVALRPAVMAALDALEPVLADRPVDVDVVDVDVLADPVLVRRALGNILSNAVKYSAPGTPITVRARQEGSTVRVEVTDEGIGLSPDDVDRVFEPFWRAGATRTRGAGLGLAIVAEYVRGMGGTVGAVSEPRRGSTFFFTLPAADPAVVRG